MNNEMKYRVKDKYFRYLADARIERQRVKAGLPSDAVVTIYRAEKTIHGVMWVPYA